MTTIVLVFWNFYNNYFFIPADLADYADFFETIL